MLRLFNIVYIFLKYDLEDFLKYLHVPHIVRLVRLKHIIWKKDIRPLEVRLRLALEELGPVFIKLGQLIATRKNILPTKFNQELDKLRDKVSPVYIDVNSYLGTNISKFKLINYDPIASASIAQVYDAVLLNDEQVVIKLLKPNIEKIIDEDLNLILQFFSANLFLSRYKSQIYKSVLNELYFSLKQEINFTNEIANAERFKDSLKDFNVLVPNIYHEFCSDNCIVMQKMFGIPIDKTDKIKDTGLDLKKISEQGLEILMIQVLRNRFFHADLHAGNIWINDRGARIFLDFGIMGELTSSDRDIIADMFSNLYLKNFKRFTELLNETDWVPDHLDIDKFILRLEEIDFRKNPINSLVEVFNLCEEFYIIIPTQFTLLAKTLLITEANAKSLNPDMNIGLVASSVLVKHFKQYIKYKQE